MNSSVKVTAEGDIVASSLLSSRFLSYLKDENNRAIVKILKSYQTTGKVAGLIDIHFFDCEVSYKVTFYNKFYTIFFSTEDCYMAQNSPDNEKYKLIVEAANEIIYECDSAGKFTYVNPKTLQITGYKEEEILGKSYLELIHPDYQESSQQFYASQLKKRVKSTFQEVPIVTSLGDKVWIGLSVQLLENDLNIIGFLGVGRDITESYHNRSELEQSEEKYRGIIQNLQFGLMEVDLDEKIVYANDAMTKVSGYAKEELIGKVASELLTNDHGLEVLKKEHKQRQRGGKGVYEIPIRQKDGTVRWAVISGAPIYNIDGTIRGSIGIHVDITERINDEEELKVTKDRLNKYKNGIEALNYVTSNLSLSSEDQISQGLKLAKKYLGLDLAIISEIKDETYTVKNFVSKDPNATINIGDQFRLGDTFCELVLKQNDIIHMSNVSLSSHTDHPSHHLFGIETYLGVSYDVNGKRRGTVNFSSSKPREHNFDGYDIEFISLFAKWIGYTITLSENQKSLKSDQEILAQKNQELERSYEHLGAINDFVTKLLVDDSIGEIAWEIAENVIDKFGYEDCVIYILDNDKEVLEQIAAYGPKQAKNRQIKDPVFIPLGEGIVGAVAKSGKAEIVNDTSKDTRYLEDDAFRYSEISVPIIADGQVIGVIDSEHKEKGFFNESHLNTLTTIANLASNRLKNAIAKKKQEKAERELTESEQKLRKILHNAIDAVITIDERGIVTEWNIQAEAIFGYSAQEAIGKSLTETIIPTKHHKAHDQGMKHFLATGRGPVLNQKIEITAMRKSGEEFPIEMAIIPVESKGRHTFTAFLSDITIQKRVQEEMEKALNKERELNELKSRFVAMTSHEFRTPLTTIKQNTDLISYQLEDDLPDHFAKYKKYIDRIDSDLNRVTSLMNDILMLGRIESGKIQINKKPVDFIQFIQRQINKSSETDLEHRVIDLHVNGVPQEVAIDEQLMDHVVSNLISNALKYSKGKEAPEISLSFNQLDRMSLTFKDHGIGIPQKDLKGLFGSFYRATNVSNIQGSGLGLSIVKEFTEMHGGTITVESTENIGSEFIIELPIS